jgi:hypothetical protein
MITQPRYFGSSAFRGLAALITLISVQHLAIGQEKPKQDDFQRFDRLKQGNDPVTPAADELFDKMAKYYVGRLNDPAVQNNGMSQLILEFGRRALPLQTPYPRLNPEQKNFVDRFGKAMITNLEPLALSTSKPIVQINATRIAGEVGRCGYDGAAELFAKILDSKTASDAVKLYALRGIKDLFAIEPDKEFQPQRTVFQKGSNLQQTDLERNSIVALISFIQTKPNLPDTAPPDEVDAYRYVRCEAIRALGKVRVQTVKNLGQVQGRPALTLLRVSRSDGLTPPTNTKERVEAIVGFCNLQADKDRDMQLDYAVYNIGQAICELAEYKNANPDDMTIPWKVAGERIQEAMDRWVDGANNLKLANAPLAQNFAANAKLNVLAALAMGQAGNAPNPAALRTWLTGQINLDVNASLFKSDPATKLSVK